MINNLKGGNNMKTQTQKKSFFKSKAFVIPAIALMAIAMISAAVVYYESINVDITVDEALSVSSAMPITVIGVFPGETVTEDIDVQNDASVPLYTTLTWAEGTNLPPVSYTTGGALSGVQTLAPGLNTLTVTWTVDASSEIGQFDGTITLDRVAAP